MSPSRRVHFPVMMRRAIPALAVAASCLLASTLAPIARATPAAADTIAEKKAEAERISRQLEDQGRRISVLAEQYNAARIEAERLEQKMNEAAGRIKTTDAEATQLRTRLKSQAVDSYVQGGAVPALALLVESKLEDDLAVKHQYAQAVTSQVGETIDELRAVKLALEDQRASLDQSRRAARAALAEANAAREQASAAQAAQERLLAKVQGELSELVAAEQQRKAEEEARRVQADLAAKRAREEAAAREAAAREASRRATTTTAPRTTAAPGTAPTTARATTTTAPKAPVGAQPEDAPPPSSGAAAAIEEAKRQLGKPYEYGGSGPDSFDCSGLTSWAWRAGGKSLPHSSQSQWSATSRVALEDLAPGDLVFYGSPIHHVGLYVGDGQMIEAPSTGKNVRYATIYRSDYTGAGRVN